MSFLGQLSALINTRQKMLRGRRYALKRVVSNRLDTEDSREEWTDAAFAAALAAKPGSFIDVGTNLGQTLLRLLSIDPDRDYVGFEPQLNCVFFVEQFIQQNRLAGKSVVPIGLSNRTGIAQLLRRSEYSDATASIIDGFRPAAFYTGKQPIYVARGDDVLAELGISDISIIKIDVEGAELEVIDGLRQTIGKHTPFIFFEVLNNFLAVTGERTDDTVTAFREQRLRSMETMLRGLGYAVFGVLPGNLVREVAAIKPGTTGDLSGVNFLAMHADLRGAFQAKFADVTQPASAMQRQEGN